jgi:hypothetical protein
MRRTKGPKGAAPAPGPQPEEDGVAEWLNSQQYEVVDVDSITEHPRNPRRAAQEVIDESIEANKFYGACIVQRSTRRILVGHGRRRGAIKKGLRRIPVIFVDVDDATARRILLADNRTADLATYDNRILLGELKIATKEGGLTGTGFMGHDVDRLTVVPPPEFPQFDETIKVHHKCPKCGYEWSGAAAKKQAQKNGDAKAGKRANA